jgi:hypothetical protein
VKAKAAKDVNGIFVGAVQRLTRFGSQIVAEFRAMALNNTADNQGNVDTSFTITVAANATAAQMNTAIVDGAVQHMSEAFGITIARTAVVYHAVTRGS